jgi:hypothetical protein
MPDEKKCTCGIGVENPNHRDWCPAYVADAQDRVPVDSPVGVYLAESGGSTKPHALEIEKYAREASETGIHIPRETD